MLVIRAESRMMMLNGMLMGMPCSAAKKRR